jgi:lipopolysaccharide transport system ATP-binding protein
MGRREISSKFDEIVAFAEIERFIDTPVKRYSSGMYLRLAFAVAAHLEPEILIVDEVLAVGDMPFQRKCLGQMDMVAREGRTVVFVSHNMAAVLRLCTTAVVLKAGGLQMRAGAVEAVAQYERSDGGENRRRVWAATEAPCDSECRLREVVASGGSDPSREVPFSTADPLRVAVTYEVLGKDALVGVTLVVYDERGTCVFSALQARKKGDVEPSAMGTYTVACVIPGGLLNARTYRISILVWGDRFEIRYRADEAVVVSMLDGGNGRSSYLGLFDGVVRPDVSWQDPVCLPRESSRQIL